LFDCNITSKIDRVRVISTRAKDQKGLRIKGESYIQKWYEFKAKFNYNGDEITIGN